jgi:hypothetical protein
MIAPLVIVAWFLWPLVPFDHSPGDIIRSVATAYALFFLSRGLAFLAYSGSRAAAHLAFVFLFSCLLSLSVSAGLMATGIVEAPFSSAAIGALQDALWCTVAAAICAARSPTPTSSIFR